ncbi:MAG: VOC family protein, partial [Bacteroidota bacterium]
MSRNNVSHAAIVLSVQDIQASIAFYRDKLGFDLTFSWGDPTNYAVLKTGEVSVHLSEDDNPRTTTVAPGRSL